MSPLKRGNIHAAPFNRPIFRTLLVRIQATTDHLAKMDITDLNLFIWCKWLRHLGRTIMALIVIAIVALAAYSTFSTALIPGMQSENVAAKAGYAILSAIYSIVVRKLSKHLAI